MGILLRLPLVLGTPNLTELGARLLNLRVSFKAYEERSENSHSISQPPGPKQKPIISTRSGHEMGFSWQRHGPSFSKRTLSTIGTLVSAFRGRFLLVLKYILCSGTVQENYAIIAVLNTFVIWIAEFELWHTIQALKTASQSLPSTLKPFNLDCVNL